MAVQTYVSLQQRGLFDGIFLVRGQIGNGFGRRGPTDGQHEVHLTRALLQRLPNPVRSFPWKTSQIYRALAERVVLAANYQLQYLVVVEQVQIELLQPPRPVRVFTFVFFVS